MVDQQKRRLEKAIGDMIEDMYRTHLKKMQLEMHNCAAHCCSDERGTLDSVQNCIEKCASPLLDAQEYLQRELGQFQSHLQSCVKDCGYDAQTKMSEKPSQREVARSQHLFENCTGRCVDKHIGLIPGLMKSMREVLDKEQLPRTIKIKEQFKV